MTSEDNPTQPSVGTSNLQDMGPPSSAPNPAAHRCEHTAAPTARPAVWRRAVVWVPVAAVALMLVGAVGTSVVLDEIREDRRWGSSSGWMRQEGHHTRSGTGSLPPATDRRDADESAVTPAPGPTPSPEVTADGTEAAPPAVAPTDEPAPRTPAGPRYVDEDAPIGEAERTALIDAALAEAGGGTVTDIDRSDDLSHAFSVDVLLSNGDQLEIHLDADHTVLWVELDRADRW